MLFFNERSNLWIFIGDKMNVPELEDITYPNCLALEDKEIENLIMKYLKEEKKNNK